MTKLFTKNDFKKYCLTRLGAPVINIDVTDDQVEDRIDDAIKMYHDYHYDGGLKVYLSVAVTQDMITSQSITLPDNISGVTGIFQVGGLTNGNNIFDFRYQVALNDLYTLTSQSMVPYFVTMQHLQFVENLLIGQKPIRFNRRNNILQIDTDWTYFDEGMFIIIEAYQILDPNIYYKIWNDRWLQGYATALIKKQWGSNLTKFGNIQMPGGVIFNGDQIYNSAVQEIEELTQELHHSYSEPFLMGIG